MVAVFFAQHLAHPLFHRTGHSVALLMALALPRDTGVPPFFIPRGDDEAEASLQSPREVISGDAWQVETMFKKKLLDIFTDDWHSGANLVPVLIRICIQVLYSFALNDGFHGIATKFLKKCLYIIASRTNIQ